MKLLRYLIVLVYRMWFYVLIVVPILIMFPFLVISVIKDTWYPYFYRMAQLWARIILYGMGFMPKVRRMQIPEPEKSYMYIANHTSMADIMLMLHVVKSPFVFVGKAELARFPLFGYFYKQTCILVDRGDPKSRMAVFESAQKRLAQGMSICIFPEGGVPEDLDLVLDTFKDGAFRLAIEHHIPIVPLVFYDNKKRFSYTFDQVSPGQMRAEVLPFISTENKKPEDRRGLRDKARQIILKELESGWKEDRAVWSP